MADFYCYVVNGVIERYNIQKPKAHGNKVYGESVTDAELAADGYFAIVGAAPAYNSATERLEGPVYAVGEGVVTRTYQVVAYVPTRAHLKQKRAEAVAAIKVTTSTGKTFDGDEDSQARMARAVLIAQATGLTETTWTLADNTIATVTLPELTEALALAGRQQAALWPIPEDAA